MLKLDVKGLGWAFGIMWAAAALLLGISAGLFGYGNEIVTLLSSIYIGYEPTVLGTIIGVIWAFVDGFICGALVAWLYNMCDCQKQSK